MEVANKAIRKGLWKEWIPFYGTFEIGKNGFDDKTFGYSIGLGAYHGVVSYLPTLGLGIYLSRFV